MKDGMTLVKEREKKEEMKEKKRKKKVMRKVGGISCGYSGVAAASQK